MPNAIAMLPAALICLSAAAGGFVQDRFVVGFWGDPPADARVDARYVEAAEAGFNLVMGGVGADTPTLAMKQRDACDRAKLKVLFATYGLPVSQLCNCPATFGFLVKDHPSAADFDAVRARAEEVRKDRPGKLPFVNLFPPSTPASELGAPDYAAYLAKYLESVTPEVLCCDEFPWVREDGDGGERYLASLALLRETSLARGIPFWAFVQAMAYGTDHVPTEAEVRWQVYSALANGAKGVLYFAYATPKDDPLVRGDGLLDRQARRTDRLDAVSRINREIAHLGSALLPLTSTGVHRTDSEASLEALLKDTPLSGLSCPGEAAPPAVLAGCFRDKAGASFVCLANQRLTGEGVVVTVSSETAAREISKKTGKLEPLADEDPAAEGTQISLAPGDGRLLAF